MRYKIVTPKIFRPYLFFLCIRKIDSHSTRMLQFKGLTQFSVV